MPNGYPGTARRELPKNSRTGAMARRPAGNAEGMYERCADESDPKRQEETQRLIIRPSLPGKSARSFDMSGVT
jgi:hypothetical protein